MNEPNYHLSSVIRSKSEDMEDFDGPLDVILQLLSKNKIEIQDISISAITEQYLAWLDQMREMDMEITSEFIAMASHLMLMKTKMLLSAAEQEEALNEMELLIRSLEERQRKDIYEKLKQAAQELEQRSESGLGLFPKEPEPYEKDQSYRYRHEPADLLSALAAMEERAQRQLPPPRSSFEGIMGKEPYPVGKKAKELVKKLLLRGVSAFRRLFFGSRSRSEIVATFLAVLELCRTRSLEVYEQDGEQMVRLIKVEDTDG